MSLLSKVFGRQKPCEIADTDCGLLSQIRDGWEGNNLSLWDSSEVQLLIDAGNEGPSDDQRRFLQSLRDQGSGIRERIEQAVTKHVNETSPIRPVVLRLTSIYIPRVETPFTWRVWYNLDGEENCSYGAEITDGEEIVPFAED